MSEEVLFSADILAIVLVTWLLVMFVLALVFKDNFEWW